MEKNWKIFTIFNINWLVNFNLLFIKCWKGNCIIIVGSYNWDRSLRRFIAQYNDNEIEHSWSITFEYNRRRLDKGTYLGIMRCKS